MTHHLIETIERLSVPEPNTGSGWPSLDLEALKVFLDKKWVPEPNTGCHLWTGSAGVKGYARAQARIANMSPEQRSAVASKGWETRRAKAKSLGGE